MFSTQIRKIKRYLEILNGYRYFNSKNLEGIEYCESEYKTGNTPPSASDFKPYENGTVWGSGNDSHAWFHINVRIPDEMKTAPVELCIASENRGTWDASNPQYIVYVNGVLRQGADINHKTISLGHEDEYDVYLYGYTGPKIPSTKLFLSLRNKREEVDGLYYDIKVPFETIDFLDEDSREYATTLAVLDKAVSMLDLYNVGDEAFFNSIIRAREFIKTEFYENSCGNSSEVAVCIGHTHIDCAWKWTFKQSREKAQRSFGTVIELMKRYPEYKFMSSQPLLYKYVKEEAPELYEEIKQRVKEGRWEPEGAMWVEADCNLTSGESLVRQIIHGKRFFKDEFGIESRVLWLPDVFGYSAALPQILKKSGVDWFVTSKISWNETNQMPYDTFMWHGIDGTGINTHFLTAQNKVRGQKPVRYTSYVGKTKPSMLAGSYYRYQNKNLSNESIITFGFGDGGGGPTEEDLEYLRRSEKGLPGIPRSEIRFAGDFLNSLEEKIDNNKLLPKWCGELYLEFHRGTYTTLSKNKKNNRECEFLYLDAENLSVLSQKLFDESFPKSELRDGWEEILNNQFHDVIPGTSIGEVYDQCDIDYANIKAIGESAKNAAETKVAENLKAGGYVVFNPHSFNVDGIVKIDGVSASVPSVPSKGYKRVEKSDIIMENHVRVDGNKVETDVYVVVFDEHWQIQSIYDKLLRREVLTGVGNEIRIYADYPDVYDAWEWQPYSKEEYKPLLSVSSVTRVSDGVREGIKVTRPYLSSRFEQTIWFTDFGRRIDFETEVDWHEHHTMVKTAFPVDINSDKATYEIQFGTIERPTHFNTSWDKAKFEVCAQKYADFSEGGYGVAILNDCKYGHDIHNGTIQLSLLRSPTDPWKDADQGKIEFTYSLMPHEGAFATSDIQREAYYLNYPMRAVKTSGKESSIPEQYSLVSINRENVICETVKEAESSQDTVIRLYESKNTKCEADIKVGFEAKKCFLCDMLEREIEEISINNGCVKVPFNAFEIVTLKFKN